MFVGDFGLCQVMSGTTIIGTKTMLAGSPGFQSPEQLRNESVGSPSDVYALGTVILVLFGETQVWPGLSHYQIMFKVAVCNESPNTEHLPIPLKDVCCLCFNEVQLRPPANIVLQHLISIIHDY